MKNLNKILNLNSINLPLSIYINNLKSSSYLINSNYNFKSLFYYFSTKTNIDKPNNTLIDSPFLIDDVDFNELPNKVDPLDTTDQKKNKKPKLPNLWDLAEIFIQDNPFIKYCSDYKTFYIYNNQYWQIVNKEELTSLFIKFLKNKFYNTYKQFNLNSLDNVFLLLSKHEKFSMPESITKANSNGFLLPFKNGVLNTKTLELVPHSPDNFTTHIIPIDYSKEDTIKDTIFETFLTSIVNNNSNRLHVLRACLFLIFTNNLTYQVALYVYGPAGTGKSRIIDILIYLLGKEVVLSSSMSQIKSRFGVASIINKTLVIINDMNLYRGQEPQNLKNLVAKDRMEAEEKFKKPFSFTPNCFLVLVSNTLWDIKNATTGLSRRMIYFPFDNVPKIKDLDLFTLEGNGEATGKLVSHLNGFINWILTCPQEHLDLIYQGGAKVTELISPDSLYVNPLQVFVKECLIQDDEANTRIGNNESSHETLYGMYSAWCEVNSINKITYKSYSILLIDLLKQLGWNISKKKIATGFVVKGVRSNLLWHTNVYLLNSDPNKIENKYYREETNAKNLTIDNSDFDNII